MGDVVNLNQYRKRRKREESRRQAAANRAKHGRSGGERRVETDARDKLERTHDGTKLAPVSILPGRDKAARTRHEVAPDLDPELDPDLEPEDSDDSKPA